MEEVQDMTILEFVMIKLLRGEKIDIDNTGNNEKFEVIKTIQKIPGTKDVIIETEEGSKCSMSLDKAYSWKIDKRKNRVKPEFQIKAKKKFRNL